MNDSGGQDEMILAGSTDELVKEYKKFLKCLPKDHPARIEDGPPRLDSVVDALRLADTEWTSNREKTKMGRAKTLFTKVAQSLVKYKDLFAIVPSGDKYVSLVAGSVSAIIKVKYLLIWYVEVFDVCEAEVLGGGSRQQ